MHKIKDLQECVNVLDNILGYHYENLTKKQCHDLCEVTEFLDNYQEKLDKQKTNLKLLEKFINKMTEEEI